MGMKRLESKICILIKRHTDQRKLLYFEFSITLQIQRQTTVSLTLAWSYVTQNGKEIETVAWSPYFNTWTLRFYKERSVSARDGNFFVKYLLSEFNILKIDPYQKITSPVKFDTDHWLKW